MSAPKPEQCFSTPVLAWEDAGSDELSHRIMEVIARERPEGPTGAFRSNRGGWHSDESILELPDRPIQELKALIVQAAQSMVTASAITAPQPAELYIYGWVNLLKHGGFNTQHEHHPSGWSGVYYLEVGEPDPNDNLAGAIEFIEPRVGVGTALIPGDPFRERVVVNPKNNMLVMFPGWLRHVVYPYHGETERVCIAYNLVFQKNG